MSFSADDRPVEPANEVSSDSPQRGGEDVTGALLTHVGDLYANEERQRRKERTEIMIARASGAEA
jgi:hypothetical protein